MKVYLKNRQRLIKLNQRKITGLLRKSLRLLGLHRAELSVLFVNDAKMRILNRQYRGVDRTTDVLSFPQISAASLIHESRVTSHEFVLGDIVINLHKAKRQAAEGGVTFNKEMKNLLIHGLLHLIGYDHEKGKEAERKMQRKAKKLFENI